MTDFRLPDLGEGLQDAEIVKWHVAVGDSMVEGDLMAEMSTAKAVVEIPAPYTGKIMHLAGIPGDTINTGEILVVFQVGDEVVEVPSAGASNASAGEATTTADAVAKTDAVSTDASSAPAAEGVEVFKLPDLGEGLQDAEVVKWHCKVGDTVTQDELMVEMSTAKAVVEVPAPFTGTIVTLGGIPGDVINTGQMLAEIATKGGTAKPTAPKADADAKPSGDAGTVVGEMVVGNEIKSEATTSKDGIKAGAAARATARKMKVDLATVTGTGAGGEVTIGDVKKAAENPASTTKPAAAVVAGAELPKDILVSPSAKAAATALGIDVALAVPADGRKTITKGDVFAAAKTQLANGTGGGSAAPAQANARASNVKISDGRGIAATPKVRAHARDQGVDIRKVNPTGHTGNVTLADVNAALKADFSVPVIAGHYEMPERVLPATGEPERLVGPRKVMAKAMAKANSEVCHTSIFEEANIGTWPKGTDITVRTMRAIVAACMVEPAMNAFFNGDTYEKSTMPDVNLGVAVDSPKGLFVPVLKGMQNMQGPAMRAELNRLRDAIGGSKITTAEMSGATITLSNFGMLAGKFATPIITPPQVAIVGIGGLFRQLVMTDNGIENLRHMPVSLTFDHRGCTGGEAARFLAAIRDDLQLTY